MISEDNEPKQISESPVDSVQPHKEIVKLNRHKTSGKVNVICAHYKNGLLAIFCIFKYTKNTVIQQIVLQKNQKIKRRKSLNPLYESLLYLEDVNE